MASKSKKGGAKLDSNEVDQEIFEQEEEKYSENVFENEDERLEEQHNYIELMMSLLDPNMRNNASKEPPSTKIQNALFVDEVVQATLCTIKTGENAISFFAKYGNTTPIKFINCVRKIQEDSTVFRPYDLVKTAFKENQKEQALDEYYTISANGIVHVWTEKGKKKASGGDTSTEVISLSDWMHESTMFNIITNIQFFKNYVIAKIFNLWKANVNYRIYCRTRQQLVHECFITKPAFANHLLEINRLMFDLQSQKTLGSLSQHQSPLDVDTQFKPDQKRHRGTVSMHYESIVDKVVSVCQTVANEVNERTKVKDQTEIEEGRFGQQVKQKPMNEIRKENEEREYLLKRAQRDKDKLRNFVRLIDYVVVEQLYWVNQISMQLLLDEMNKNGT